VEDDEPTPPAEPLPPDEDDDRALDHGDAELDEDEADGDGEPA
jgi:hypothetical protein